MLRGSQRRNPDVLAMQAELVEQPARAPCAAISGEQPALQSPTRGHLAQQRVERLAREVMAGDPSGERDFIGGPERREYVAQLVARSR